MSWDAAFDICRKVFAYTNHTVMSEALEKWNADIFRTTLPRIWQIVCEMDRRCRADLAQAFPGDQGKIDYMAIIGDNQVRTANICAYTCHAINGVSKLHSEIIKDSVFHDYYLFKPNDVQKRHQRHRLPPLAALLQPRPDPPAGGDHRRRLQDRCL